MHETATPDKAVFLTLTQLKERGWTDTLVRDLLRAPDQTRTNPHYRSGPPMRLYDITRVEGVERSAAWAESAKKTRRRKEAAAQAVETKRTQLQAHLEKVEITVPILDDGTLKQLPATIIICGSTTEANTTAGTPRPPPTPHSWSELP